MGDYIKTEEHMTIEEIDFEIANAKREDDRIKWMLLKENAKLGIYYTRKVAEGYINSNIYYI